MDFQKIVLGNNTCYIRFKNVNLISLIKVSKTLLDDST